MSSYPRGSEWRKWDLHVHTPASFCHNFRFKDDTERQRYNNDIWDKFIDALAAIDDIVAIGITDYFGIDGYKKVLDYRNGGKLLNFKLVLPNVEFRLNIITASDKRLNLHLLFTDSIPLADLDDLMARINLALSDSSSDIPQGVSCTRNGLIQVGKSYSNDESLSDEQAYKIGCEQAVIDFNQLIEVLQKTPNLTGKYFLIGVEDSPGGLSEISYDQSGQLRLEIYKKCRMIESCNENTINFWLGKLPERISERELMERFGSMKPCIHGSDAHTFARLCKPDKNRFCWIKADPTFEGLKQIIYEPEDRVCIQQNNPESRKTIYTLRSTEISNSVIYDDLSIVEQKIPLNRNLVAVTGGKGSGKTALLDLLANCFQDRCRKSGRDDSSFVQRIEDLKPDLKICVDFLGEQIGDFCKILTEEKLYPDAIVTYLPQGKIEEYSADRKKLDAKIEDIIFRNKDVIAGDYRTKFDSIAYSISELTRSIDELNYRIFELESETGDDLLRNISKKKNVVEGELKNKEDEIRELSRALGSRLQNKIETLKKEETDLRVRHSLLEDLKIRLDSLQQDLAQYTADVNAKIEGLNRELTALKIGIVVPKTDTTASVVATNGAIEKIASATKTLLEEISVRNAQLDKFSGVEKIHTSMLRERDRMKQEVESCKKQLEEFENKKKELTECEVKRISLYQRLIETYNQWKQYYEEIIAAFSGGQSDIMHGVVFSSCIFVDVRRFVEIGLDIFDLRRIDEKTLEAYGSDLRRITQVTDSATSKNLLSGFVKKIHSTRKLLKTTRTGYDFYQWVYGSYFDLSTQVLFNGISLDKLSIGQKGTVLLKLFLAEGDYPLIIDQPEESLDNKFIYDELVSAFREAKKKRQVIIATNNANLVVNTDAEQVIIADYSDNKISYESGSLENVKLRKQLLPILEGGKEAFEKRERKYGFGQ